MSNAEKKKIAKNSKNVLNNMKKFKELFADWKPHIGFSKPVVKKQEVQEEEK